MVVTKYCCLNSAEKDEFQCFDTMLEMATTYNVLNIKLIAIRFSFLFCLMSLLQSRLERNKHFIGAGCSVAGIIYYELTFDLCQKKCT